MKRIHKLSLADSENYLLLKVISGSKLYGTDIEGSDTDIRGIFMLPNHTLMGLGYKDQTNDKKNDIVYYELNRFVDLLSKNNPNIIELLFAPSDKILYKNDILAPLYKNKKLFLTKNIKNTFGGYAISQIKKAQGLNKKIVNPLPKEKKTPLDFCFVIDKNSGYMTEAVKWFESKKYNISKIGLSELPNGIQTYKMYYDNDDLNFKGICNTLGNELLHSEIPKDYSMLAFLYYNKNGYSAYCKQYKEYWEWVNDRNPIRHKINVEHGKNYDGKNLLHCFRLLDTAIEIAEGKGVNVFRNDRDFLLDVRYGKFEYDYLIDLANKKVRQLDEAIANSNLPNEIDLDMVHDTIMEIRNNNLFK